GLSENTLAAYRRDLDRYVAHLRVRGRSAPADVGEADVETFVTAPRSPADDGAVPLAASSAARALAAVRGWHRFCALEGLVPEDVASGVRPPAQPRRLPKAISTHAGEQLLEATGSDDGPTSLRDRALLELLYST